MLDAVSIDSIAYYKTLDHLHAEETSLERQTQAVRDEFLSSPESFGNITESFYVNYDFPVEAIMLRLLKAKQNEEVLCVALELKALLENRLDTVANDIATARTMLLSILNEADNDE